MPYREKTAWLALVAMAVTLGPYFVTVSASPHRSDALPNVHFLILFAVAVSIQVIIMIAGHAYMAIRFRDEARTPPDERDQAILHRSLTGAYYVLLSGMILVGCIMPFNSVGWKIVNAGLFTIFVAELVRYGMIVVSYRRQA